MSIRYRMLLIVLPLIVTSLIIAQIITATSARSGMTEIATDFLRFKTEQLHAYSESQWRVLVQNDLHEQGPFVEAAKSAVRSFSRTLTLSETEVILAVNSQGEIAMTSRDFSIDDDERQQLERVVSEGTEGWHELPLGGTKRVAWVAPFEPFDWHFLVTEAEASFFAAVDRITYQTAAVIVIALVISTALLLVFTHYLVSPLRSVAGAMQDIIRTNDLSRRVDIDYDDETGRLGHSFNVMVRELGKAYDQIKEYALQAGIARHKEQRIRNIFQKYVPNTVIDQFFSSPESMLIGQDRELAVLFSDIRGFTPISEGMEPHELVESLNRYFDGMVDAIMNREGVVDKYIGDAIMAFYGAPVKREDDALQATLSALDMVDRLVTFNTEQRRLGLAEFRTGIGISYGAVTVGNIGNERKMDYTVIGDMVNLSSRLEGLTKQYEQHILISDSVCNQLGDEIACRRVDRVVVKGRRGAVDIYSPTRTLSPEQKRGWNIYHQALDLYYQREFEGARELFERAAEALPGDRLCELYIERAEEHIASPPPDVWTGATVMTEK